MPGDAETDNPPADDTKLLERAIASHRREGEGGLSEWLMGRPNRFSPPRRGGDVFVLGLLSCVCLLPLGPVAIVRGVRCNDQRRESDLPPSRWAHAGMVLGLIGTGLLILGLWWLSTRPG